VIEKIRIVAKSHSTVLLRGESGTGKELFASAIHELSPRRKAPFVKVNCAAIPESVLESELFGHEKGAFTGAVVQRKGRFELADGGTLFLDEIGEISASFQAKLLRVLQEGEFERVGGTRTLKVDVRLVCATNQNLEEAVERGTFRSDLYYRISVVPILLPPLRARKGDVPLLAEEFVRRFNAEHGTELSLSGSALGVLDDCYFPGNIRELENCVRRTATLARGSQIVDVDFACRNDVCLSSVLWRGAQRPAPAFEQELRVAPRAPVVAAPAGPLEAAASCPSADACPVAAGDGRSERDRLVEAMRTAGWVQAKAARLLGLTPRQVGYALRKHGVAVEKF
jgi:Nif-specific regulatory protein